MHFILETNKSIAANEVKVPPITIRNYCEICDRYFAKPCLLRRHQLVHSAERAFGCGQCQQKFKQKSSLTRHIATLHKPTAYKSSKGREQESANNVDQLTKNVLAALKQFQAAMPTDANDTPVLQAGTLTNNRDIVAPLETQVILLEDKLNPSHLPNVYPIQVVRQGGYKFYYVCEYCSKVFPKKYDLIRHRRLHTKEKPYKCIYCIKRYATQAMLNEHMRRLHCNPRQLSSNSKQQICHICDLTYTSVRQLDIHTLACHPECSYQCDFCDSSIRKKAALSAHQKREADTEMNMLVELLPEPIVNSLSQRRFYKCIYCSSKFLRKYNCRSHMRSHLKQLLDKSAPRKLCESRRTEFVIHNRTEMNSTCIEYEIVAVAPNTCVHCARIFKKPSDLQRHLRTHTHEKPYSCEICNRKFSLRSTLNRHKQTHTVLDRRRKILCQVCGKAYATNGALKVHQRLHTGEQPFKCEICKETFRTSRQRLTHIRAGKHAEQRRQKLLIE